MTKHPDTRPAAAARTLRWLALPLLLLTGCASGSTPPAAVQAPEAPVAVAATPASPGDVRSAQEAQANQATAAAAAASAVAAAEAEEQVAAPVPVDPVRPDVHLDLDDRAARVDLWDRVRRGFAMPDLD